MVVEPDVVTVLKASDANSDDASTTFEWAISPIVDGVTMKGSVVFIDEDPTNAEIHVTFSPANSKYLVSCTSSTGVSVSYTATAKRVRREIRTLPSTDVQAYFKAMKIMFTTSQEEGVEKYGDSFISHAHLAALHDSDEYRYHGNLFFQTSHPTMQIKADKSLLAIDPTLVLPYWDFLIDADLGKNWATSVVYDEDWFGPVDTSPESDYRILGTFAEAKMVYDPDATLFPKAYHTLSGYLGVQLMTTSSEYLQRSNSYCGFKSVQGFSDCAQVQSCFEAFAESRDFYEYDICMENNVHANLHEMHAGFWDCQVSWDTFFKDNSDWLDEMFFSIIAQHISSLVKTFVQKGYVTCPDSCVGDKGPGSCLCTSALSDVSTPDDVDDLTSEYRLDLMKTFWEVCDDFYQGSDYVEKFEKPWPDKDYEDLYVPMTYEDSGVALPFEQVDSLNALMLKTVLFPGVYGFMHSGAAAADPLFWVMHQMFDKAAHALRLSPRYNKDGFTWNNKVDFMTFDGETPFKQTIFDPYLGSRVLPTTSDGFLTNNQLWALLAPDSNAIDYVYDQMTSWGSCAFDPFSS